MSDSYWRLQCRNFTRRGKPEHSSACVGAAALESVAVEWLHRVIRLVPVENLTKSGPLSIICNYLSIINQAYHRPPMKVVRDSGKVRKVFAKASPRGSLLE